MKSIRSCTQTHRKTSFQIYLYKITIKSSINQRSFRHETYSAGQKSALIKAKTLRRAAKTAIRSSNLHGAAARFTSPPPRRGSDAPFVPVYVHHIKRWTFCRVPFAISVFFHPRTVRWRIIAAVSEIDRSETGAVLLLCFGLVQLRALLKWLRFFFRVWYDFFLMSRYIRFSLYPALCKALKSKVLTVVERGT